MLLAANRKPLLRLPQSQHPVRVIYMYGLHQLAVEYSHTTACISRRLPDFNHLASMLLLRLIQTIDVIGKEYTGHPPIFHQIRPSAGKDQ